MNGLYVENKLRDKGRRSQRKLLQEYKEVMMARLRVHLEKVIKTYQILNVFSKLT